MNNTQESLIGLDHGPYGYDAVWTVALALQKADNILKQMGKIKAVTKRCFVLKMEHYGNMTLKITLKSPTTLKNPDTNLKILTKDNHTEIHH